MNSILMFMSPILILNVFVTHIASPVCLRLSVNIGKTGQAVSIISI